MKIIAYAWVAGLILIYLVAYLLIEAAGFVLFWRKRE